MADHTTEQATNEIPYGFCYCGCGQKTNLAPRADKRKGWNRGEPLRFISGHQARRDIEPPNPSGLCMCGCGQKTEIAKQSHSGLGYVKGKPIRFVAGHQSNGRTKPDPVGRFWANIAVGDPDACWEWQGRPNKQGYGIFRINGRQSLTHRISYELHSGAIPDGLSVLHKCDNPPCCNPAHLFLGTQADNMDDCKKKGRAKSPQKGQKGEAHGMAKLTEDDVYHLRRLRAQGETCIALGVRFGVDPNTISSIARRKSWKHID